MKNRFLVAALVGLLVVLSLPLGATAQDTQTPDELCAASLPASDPATLQFDQPEQVLEAGVNYQAIFCTEAGAVYVDLFEAQTPVTVNNFVFLAQQGYYNNSTFHRVIEGFMAQAGDPVGNPPGTGGPGYQFEDEPVSFLTFDSPGWLAMANAGPATNGSQFFITTAVTDWLNYRHTIFGRVLEGQSVVDSLPDNQSDPNLLSRLETVLIITDPASVSSSYQAPELASREDVSAALAAFPSQFSATLQAMQAPELAEILSVDEANLGVQEIAEYIAATSETADASALEAYYSANPAEYHARFGLTNSACDLANFPVGLMRYDLDAYATEEAAQSALEESQLVALQAAQGFEPFQSELGLTLFRGSATLCEQALVVMRSVQQRGRFVAFIEVAFVDGVIAPSEENVQLADYLLSQFVPSLIESPLMPIYRAELLQ
jgi:cyclophilin family peptidyl-prolyl cis-trans isomerase